MTSCVFGTAILFALNLVPFPCEGKITSPPSGTRLTFLPGSTEKIRWTFDDHISTVRFRDWFFTSSNTSRAEQLAIITRNSNLYIRNSSLPGVYIEKPATLVLKNVDLSYNGTYEIYLVTVIASEISEYSSEVVVYIAEKPTVTLSCSSPIIVNEGDDFTCVCRGEGGNPPADVTWYKDGLQIGETGKEEQTLTVSNADGTDSGTYKCEARSHTNATFVDEESIEVQVNFKPKETSIALTPKQAIFGKPVTITCQSNGFPQPIYTITHNDTEVSTKETHTISKLNWSDAGSYRCVSTNELGSNSKSYCLTVVGETAASKKVDCESCGTVVAWHIVISLVSGIIIGVLLTYIVWCSRRRWFGNLKPERNPEPQTTEADTTYRVHAASNDDDSTYTELNKTRDEESNYQSLLI